MKPRMSVERAAAEAAALLVEDDMVVGLGTGSTAAFALGVVESGLFIGRAEVGFVAEG